MKSRESVRKYTIGTSGLLFALLVIAGCQSPVTIITPAQTYTVTYDDNGATEGEVPVDALKYSEGTSATVLGNTGNLVAGSGLQFAGWNTASDGSGVDYQPGDALRVGGNLVLYAVWSPVYSVTYEANGATDGSAPNDENEYSEGASVTVLGNPGNLAMDSGLLFAGWNTAADGNGEDFAPGAVLTVGDEDVVLYAVWESGFRVTYHGNGGTGGVPFDYGVYQNGDDAAVLGAGTLTKAGYQLAVWNTEADGSGVNHAVGSTLDVGAAGVDLYALWIPSNLTFTASGSSLILTGYTTPTVGVLNIPLGVTGIAASAFYHCDGLTGLVTPTSLTSIGQGAFYQCFDLETVSLGEGLTALPADAFVYCESLTSVSLPSTLTSIGGGAFMGDTSLVSLTIPASVTSLGAGVFQWSSALTSVTFQSAAPPAMGDTVFYNNAADLQIHVPSGSLAAYQAADDWAGYVDDLVSP